MPRIVKKDMLFAGLTINGDKKDGTPLHERLHFGFDVDLAFMLFKIPISRWGHLQFDILSILNSRGI